MERAQQKRIIEAALMVANRALNVNQLAELFGEENSIENKEIKDIVKELSEEYSGRGIEIKEIASGFRFQVCPDLAEWVQRLWEEKPSRYSRALLETLALMAYKQPITRAEIEEVRGVAVSTNIVKTLLEQEWIRVVGQKDVPGKPSLYGTTKKFLDDFNLKSLNDLPSLNEIKDIEDIAKNLDESVSDNSEATEAGTEQHDEMTEAVIGLMAGESEQVHAENEESDIDMTADDDAEDEYEDIELSADEDEQLEVLAEHEDD